MRHEILPEVGEPDLALTPVQSRALIERAYRISGVRVDADNVNFLRLRLSRRLAELGCRNFGEYIERLEADADGRETLYLVEALTTHTTAFFRERRHYDWLSQEGFRLLNARPDIGGRPFLIWSAACSTGAELWTAGMLAMEHARLEQMNIQLVGTDISRKILVRAAKATFPEEEVTIVPEALLWRYFLRSKPSARTATTLYRVVPELTQKASFLYANLHKLSQMRPFTADLIFLRNVLIYFEPDARETVLRSVLDRLSPGGFLLTGHSEALPPDFPGVTPVSASIYRKN